MKPEEITNVSTIEKVIFVKFSRSVSYSTGIIFLDFSIFAFFSMNCVEERPW